jgi:DNA-directed RNA polymerase III subunit RPC3
VQKCHLPLRQIQHGLAVLVQAGLLYHHTTSEGRTFYEANPRNAYHLVRSGRIIDIVQKRYGKAAAAITSQLLVLGHASIGHLKKSHRASNESAGRQDGELDGIAADNSPVSRDPVDGGIDSDIETGLEILCRHGLVCRLRQAHFRTEADTRQTAEEKVFSRPIVSTAKGTKAKEEMAAKIETEIEKQVDTHIYLTNAGSHSMVSQKRKASELDESILNPKRLKVLNGVSSQQPDLLPSSSLDDEYNSFNGSLVVRINNARIAVLVRNNRLIALASQVYGSSVSQTYEAILKQLEPDLPDPKEDTSLGPENERPPLTSSEVSEHRLAQELAHMAANSEFPRSHWPSINGYVNGINHRLKPETRAHLEILCQEPYRLLSHSSEYPERYVVEYASLSVHLRNAEVFRIVSSRFGKHSVRIVRVLLDKGKLDEKYLQEIVLMSAKELRQALAMLQQAGFLELQEVPREAQRQPSRTMYLWFYDADRVRNMLIEDTYTCMARCMQRMRVERDKVKPTIEKTERSDVKGQEEKLLAKAELQVLRAWRRKEEWLLGEIGRLDELIFVLRDF